MNDIEDRLRKAFQHEASTVTEQSLRPAEPPWASDIETSSWRRAGHRRWIWPVVAAAAAVAAVTIGVAAIHSDADRLVGPAGHTPPATVTSPSTSDHITLGYPHQGFEEGRRYDVGTIYASKKIPVNGLVIYIHRVSVYGMTDQQVAEHGVTPEPSTDSLYGFPGHATFVAPVLHDAVFTVNVCGTKTVNGHQVPHLYRHTTSAAHYLKFQLNSVSIFSFDTQGRLISAQTGGGC